MTPLGAKTRKYFQNFSGLNSSMSEVLPNSSAFWCDFLLPIIFPIASCGQLFCVEIETGILNDFDTRR